MRRLALLAAIAAVVACDRTETRSTATDTSSALPTLPDTGAAARTASLDDTSLALAPAPRAPAVLAVDPTVKAATIVGTNQPATPFCAAGLKDSATGVTLYVVRSMQRSFKPTGSRDSTIWGRADYKPSDPARFGLQPTQVLRVDCGTRRVLGIAPDITTATAPPPR